MRIRKTMTVDFGDFTLDTDKIALKSANRHDIMLPYSGCLPAQLSGATGAQIYFNIQVYQPVRIVLVLSGLGKERNRYPLDVSNAELTSLLDRFFGQKTNLGLTDYDHGLWRGNYITWRQLIECPTRLTSFLERISQDDRGLLLGYLSGANEL